jgi:tripartite-type tricarboxylate transporter receptor subunit TctC
MKTHKKPLLFKTFEILLALSMLFAFPAAAFAAGAYPTKPVRLIIPQPPGGGTDNIARLIAPKLSERLGTPVVMEYRPGAATIIGTELVAKSAPDGYTLLFAPASYAASAALQKLPYDPINSFSPIAKIGEAMSAVVVHPSLPAKSLKQLITLAKEKPGQLIFSCQGMGSQQHLLTELFKTMADIDIKLVQFKGGGPAMIDLLGGHSHGTIGAIWMILPHIKAGKFKPLCVLGAKRSVLLPDVPTATEEGVPGCESGSWWGMLAPAGTPAPIIDRLSKDLEAIVAKDELRSLFLKEGLEVDYQGPTEFAAFIKSDLTRWAGVVKRANITPEQ